MLLLKKQNKQIKVIYIRFSYVKQKKECKIQPKLSNSLI